MNARTRLLLILMSVVGLVWMADAGYRNLIEGPAADRERELDRLTRQVAETQDSIIKTSKAADVLAVLEQFSLPYDPELARAAYQDWLLGLVQQAEMTGASVDASQPAPVKIKDRDSKRQKEIYVRYNYSLRARGNLQQVTKFLYLFYRSGHLHKISSISLNPVGGGRSVDMSLAVEAIGLSRCERKGELSPYAATRLTHDPFQDYLTIARRNLFSRGGDSVLAKTTVTAVTVSSDGVAEAWISLPDNETSVLRRGQSVETEAHVIEVVDVLDRQVLLDVDGQVITVRAGETLAEATSSG
ncbi:hypothetical protein [Crateriforma conspicua]|uniref:Uncharacterized protein n=1 Tax=Crateriforma conspicua TaxID=2527996 RepID=A0A5C6FR48_9PLAN|nr:hypothetical protein [Crateriforma conspicua]TWU65642.1 hypothetical protein V7x_11900 [Crateriforma conspicua]